jgi:hypothetical protein
MCACIKGEVASDRVSEMRAAWCVDLLSCTDSKSSQEAPEVLGMTEQELASFNFARPPPLHDPHNAQGVCGTLRQAEG